MADEFPDDDLKLWLSCPVWPLQLAVDLVCDPADADANMLDWLSEFATTLDTVSRFERVPQHVKEAIMSRGDSEQAQRLCRRALLMFGAQDFEPGGMLTNVTIHMGDPTICWVEPGAFLDWVEDQGVDIPSCLEPVRQKDPRTEARQELQGELTQPGGAQDTTSNIVREDRGGIWLFRFKGEQQMFLKGLKGFRQIALLLDRPGQQLLAPDLDPDNVSFVYDESNYAMLDDEGATNIKARLERIEIAKDAARNDLVELDRLAAEERELHGYLHAGRRKNGTARAFTTPLEQARKRVHASIKRAERAIKPLMPELHAHLDRFLRLGTQCVYLGQETWEVTIL